MTNAVIARRLQEHAIQLRRAGANLYRVRACRQAVLIVSGFDREIADCDEAFLRGAGLGESLARTVHHYATTGAWVASEPRSAVAPSEGDGIAPCVPPLENCSN